MTRNRLSRRDFLKRSTGFIGVASMISAAGQIGCVPSTAPAMKAELANDRIVFDTAIPELANIGDGVKLENLELEYPILLIKNSDYSFSALSTECMHLGCQVRMQRTALRCPCHGSVYNLEGKILNGPTERPLKSFPVRMNGKLVEIALS